MVCCWVSENLMIDAPPALKIIKMRQRNIRGETPLHIAAIKVCMSMTYSRRNFVHMTDFPALFPYCICIVYLQLAGGAPDYSPYSM